MANGQTIGKLVLAAPTRHGALKSAQTLPGRLVAFAVAFCGGFRHYGHMAGFEERPNEPANSARPDGPTDVSVAVASALGGLIAAWVAAGSAGLLAHPLRRAATLALLVIAILVRRPIGGVRPKTGLAILPLVLGVAVFMAILPAPAANAMAAAVVLAFLAILSAGRGRDVLLASSAAVAVFGVYRFAVTAIPWLWLAADFIGTSLGTVAGWLAGQPLRVGATFAGLDFLILTSVVWAIYLRYTKPPRTARAIYGFLAILGGHLAYLILLAHVPDFLAAFPLSAAGANESRPLLQFLHKAVPWNLPAIACAIHSLIVAAMFRWSAWAGESDGHVESAEPVYASEAMPSDDRLSRRFVLALAAVVAALLLPFIATFAASPAGLEGKRIVFHEKGFLNWLKPTHGSYGRLSSGMYGMLPVLMESLGARCLVSPDLSDADVNDADVLVLIFPNEPWQAGQAERIHRFVRRGGSLLVFGEHTTRDADGSNRFNEILAPTAMRVRFDSATFAVGGWLQSYEALSHPATMGIADDQNQFGVVIGASVAAHWPARPLLVGRWGWADDGDEANAGERGMLGNNRYEAGEKLGDVVLAAEQPLGRGRVIAFGDTSGLSNAIDVSSYQFTSRLFAYLAGGGTSTHAAWRQMVVLLAGALLVALVCRRPGPWKTSLAAIGLTASLVACAVANPPKASLLPDGRLAKPNNLAYIDASHVEAYSSESWRPEGVGGLALTLMRSGYLALDLPAFTPERLKRAGLVISIAPTRAFSPAEVEAAKAFVTDGGTLILMTGYEQRACAAMLNAFGLRVGTAKSSSLEPEPLGHFKSPYLEAQGKRVYVRFHAAWPVAATEPNEVIANGRDNQPVIIMRRVGAGRVLLIGDPCFAMNMNLENENGAPFEGLRENADFWRWLLTMIRGEPMWVPPALQSTDATPAPGASSKEAGP